MPACVTVKTNSTTPADAGVEAALERRHSVTWVLRGLAPTHAVPDDIQADRELRRYGSFLSPTHVHHLHLVVKRDPEFVLFQWDRDPDA